MKILLVVYDNGSFVPPFPQGLAYIAGTLVKEGYQVEIYNQDMHHYPDEHLTEYLNKNHYNVVGVNVIAGYYQYKKLKEISKAINAVKNKPIYILGGHGPSPDPTFFLLKMEADIVVIGEGEETIKEVIKAINDNRNLKDIKGIAYRNSDNKVIINKRRLLIQNVEDIPFPAYHLFPIEFYRLQRYVHTNLTDLVMPVLSGRGCTFKCSFCYRLDTGFRPRNNWSILHEIEFLHENYRINIIDFSDELLMSSIDRTISLCQYIIDSKLNIRWHCNGRLNYATPKVLKIMKKAGCIFINYGIEAMDNDVLRLMNKGLTTDIIIKGVEETLKVGISPGLNIMWGCEGDNKETLKKAVDFLIKYDDCAQMRTLRFVTPYPGCPLYYKAIKMGLLKDCEDFYENKHKNSDLLAINFTDMKEEDMYQDLYKANCKLINNYYSKHAGYMKKQAKQLYLQRDDSFRGFRQF
ncbi:hypothetical protein LCGC14_1563620 [marine sediment metagenome]|uniref:Uncharacterized protein n=1 Tax=marine sediment metagenome TaxID=412755 RepID=A0A0F9L2Y4_9ZZZZ